MPDRVFISHAKADKPIALELRDRFAKHGLSAWIDSRELAPGSRLEPDIERAIGAATHVVAVLSPQTVNSRWVTKEIKLAHRLNKPISVTE